MSAARTTAGVLATTVAVSSPVFLVGGLAVQIGADFPLSPAQLGLVVAAYFGVSALASVPAGALVERHGPARAGRCGIALTAASMLAVAAGAHSAVSLTLLVAAGAAGNALGQLAGNATLAQRVPARHHGLSFGLKQAAVPACTLLAGAAVPAVAVTVGWRPAFVVAAVLAGATLALPAGGAAAARTPFVRPRGPLLLVGAAALLGAAGANALGAFLVSSAVAGGVAPGRAGLSLSLGSAVCVAARVAGGRQADRRPAGQGAVVAALLGGGAAGMLLLALPGDAALLAGSLLAFGLGWSWPGLLNFAVARRHPRAPAAATSITLMGAQAGACLGPLGLGVVATVAGYPAMWMIAAAVMATAAALTLAGRAAF